MTATIEVTDALGRSVRLDGPASRVVSLVPSETLSVVELAGADRLAGRTEYCEDATHAQTVGGTKGFDVDAIMGLEPDLVLANKEENGEKLVRRLIERGLPVHVSFPCTVVESGAYLRSLACLLGVAETAPILRFAELAARPLAQEMPFSPLKVFVPIWKDPWMTFDDRAFASDLLAVCGADNVFGGRERRYPLAADLGARTAWSEARVGERDTRYPRLTLEEAQERGPEAVLLPDEPFRFTEEDKAFFDELLPDAIVSLVPGKDLFWYGTQTVRSIDRMRVLIANLQGLRLG